MYTAGLPGAPTDAELVLSAQTGALASLGLLLARHEPMMYGVALALLGYGPDAQDMVQDAALVAVRRIGDLRDPAAAGAWLRAIVRNTCRMHLRSKTEVPVADLDTALPPDLAADPAELLDRHGAREEVWRAIHALSPNLRLVTMLRYFTDVNSYDQIAQVCEVPIGTVRSRLSQARTKLHDSLLRADDGPRSDVDELTRLCRLDAEEVMRAADRGALRETLAESWDPGVAIKWPQGTLTRGLGDLVRAWDCDLADGVRQRLTNVVASRDVLIWEADLISPPDDPHHCPPALVWVQYVDDHRITRVRLYHQTSRASMQTAEV